MSAGRLEGKVVLITGAGSGMGAEATVRFAREGAKVVACDMNLEAAQRAAQTAQAAGGKAIAVAMNVAKEDEVKAGVAAAVASAVGCGVPSSWLELLLPRRLPTARPRVLATTSVRMPYQRSRSRMT